MTTTTTPATSSSTKKLKLLTDKYDDEFKYQQGFGGHFSTEALEGALPHAQNTPQKCNYGLYAEQLSGTAFTAPRVSNQRTWFYRILPSAYHLPWEDYKAGSSKIDFNFAENPTPAQLRWMPAGMEQVKNGEQKEIDFVDGLFSMCGSGSAQSRTGFAVHMYCANSDMKNKALANADGDFLILPQQGTLIITTEMGKLLVRPQELCVIPRGIKFSVALRYNNGLHENPEDNKTAKDFDFCRGYIAEVYQGHFVIPDLGPIGANGLANPRDFSYPVAYYEDLDIDYTLVHKYQSKLFEATMNHSPFNVVAWHGNYAPYKYNLNNFNTINTVSFDHLDPSIFTVLTCPSTEYGTAVMDFVIFPPRWGVAEKTFRPPYFHRNIANEFMGLIYGMYEAKEEGFVPGGASLHTCMSSHGPETQVFEKASNAELKPERVAEGSLAFMFETAAMMNPTNFAMQKLKIDQQYYKCWQGFKKHFNPSKK